MQKGLEECMRTNSNTPPPAVINTASKNTDHKQHRGPLSDGPEGVTKMVKYYKNCDNACWSCGYDVSKKHDSGNCMKKSKVTLIGIRVIIRRQVQVSKARSS